MVYGTRHCMPKEGYKTITITEELYDDLKHKYETEKTVWFRMGVRSFSSYVAYRLAEMLEEEN